MFLVIGDMPANGLGLGEVTDFKRKSSIEFQMLSLAQMFLSLVLNYAEVSALLLAILFGDRHLIFRNVLWSVLPYCYKLSRRHFSC